MSVTQLQNKLESARARQKEKAALASKAEAEVVVLRVQQVGVVAVLVQQLADLLTQAQQLNQSQDELRALKVLLANQEGEVLQTRITHSNQKAELVSLINQLEEAHGEIQLQQTTLTSLVAVKEQLTAETSGSRPAHHPRPSLLQQAL